jgi:hypothetical protein
VVVSHVQFASRQAISTEVSPWHNELGALKGEKTDAAKNQDRHLGRSFGGPLHFWLRMVAV